MLFRSKIQNLQDNDSVITVNKIVGQGDDIDKAIEEAVDKAVEQTKLIDVAEEEKTEE